MEVPPARDWIWATALTSITAAAMPDPLTCCAGDQTGTSPATQATAVGFFFFFFVFCLFRAKPVANRGSQGLNRSCSCWPNPQPKQRRIQAASVTYPTAHGNARSLNRWVRPGIEALSSLVGFINHWAVTGTPTVGFLTQCATAETPKDQPTLASDETALITH